jgi:hypothetical protein
MNKFWKNENNKYQKAEISSSKIKFKEVPTTKTKHIFA